MTTKILSYFTIVLSLLTATGVFIHDARIDKATFGHGSAHYKRNVIASGTDIGLQSDAHVHPEKIQKTLRGFAYQSPSIHPRETKHKRYMLQNIEPSGRHAFDNYNLPIIA